MDAKVDMNPSEELSELKEQLRREISELENDDKAEFDEADKRMKKMEAEIANLKRQLDRQVLRAHVEYLRKFGSRTQETSLLDGIAPLLPRPRLLLLLLLSLLALLLLISLPLLFWNGEPNDQRGSVMSTHDDSDDDDDYKQRRYVETEFEEVARQMQELEEALANLEYQHYPTGASKDNLEKGSENKTTCEKPLWESFKTPYLLILVAVLPRWLESDLLRYTLMPTLLPFLLDPVLFLNTAVVVLATVILLTYARRPGSDQ